MTNHFLFSIQLNSPFCKYEAKAVPDKHQINKDSVTASTPEELIHLIRSNRYIKLLDSVYNLKSSLLLDSIENLDIVGTGATKLMAVHGNSTVIKLLNSQSIKLEGLIIGHVVNMGHKGEQGAIRISYSSHIDITDCKLIGSGTFGLITSHVNKLIFINSEITACSALIFELDSCRNFEFLESKFHNNNLGASVLGGFTNSTRDINFLKCDFINNKPHMTGNPAFNFMNNYDDFDNPIIFTNCTFRNNKGYKWYGKNIELINCKIDSSDFIGLQRSN